MRNRLVAHAFPDVAESYLERKPRSERVRY